MKRIIKTRCPGGLDRWIRKQRGKNCSYRDMPSNVKEAVLKSLLKEQGSICCYTGLRITTESSHIEHLKPQRISRANNDNDDVNYENMLAAYPHPDPKSPDSLNCPFGAHKKEDWFGEDEHGNPKDLLVHPLQIDCENRFIFDLQGLVSSKEGDKAAETTITKLELNHGKLVGNRKAAIDALYTISEAQLRTDLENIMKRKTDGAFKEFCFVLAQVGPKILKKKEHYRIKRTAIHQQQD